MRLLGAVSLILGLLAGPALSQPADVVAADRAVMAKVERMQSADELAGLKGELETVVSHAPARYRLIDQTGQDVTLRLPGDQQGIAEFGMSDQFRVALTGKPDRLNLTIDENIYGDAAFLVGWLAKNEGDLDGSIRWFDKGLAFQPDNPVLVVEKGVALTQQKKFADALAAYDRWMAANPLMVKLDTGATAVLHRSRGAALLELKRPAEAEAAYRASLEIEPDNVAGLTGLQQVAAQRGGAAPTP